jgi:DNA topoisomerase-2
VANLQQEHTFFPGCPQVFYNGQRLKIKSFQEYVDLYLGPKETGPKRVYERFSDRWEVCIASTEGQFNQVGAVLAAFGGQQGVSLGQLALP